MKNDPVVEEVRRTRRKILAECGDDLNMLIARLKAGDSRNKVRLVTVEDIRRRSRSSTGAPNEFG